MGKTAHSRSAQRNENIGWTLAGIVKPDEDVEKAIQNLLRPAIFVEPKEIQEGKVKKGGVNEKPTMPPPEPPKGQGGTRIIDDFSHWPKNECWPKNEMILRRLLFMEHHCDEKYGDDGEMQCGKCQIDFCRDSAEEIERKTEARNLERMRKWSEENPNFWSEGFPKGKILNIAGDVGPCKCDGTGKHPIPGDLG